MFRRFAGLAGTFLGASLAFAPALADGVFPLQVFYAGATASITSPAPTASAATISGNITNPNNGGVINGVTVNVYKNGSTSVCSGTTNSSGAWSCSATSLANGDVLYASAAENVLSASQTAVIASSNLTAQCNYLTGQTGCYEAVTQSGTPTYINSSLNLATVGAANTVRISYDTGSSGYGWLNEPAEATISGYSNAFSSWTASGATPTQNLTGPDSGANTGWSITESGSGTIKHQVYQTVSASGSKTYIVSAFLDGNASVSTATAAILAITSNAAADCGVGVIFAPGSPPTLSTKTDTTCGTGSATLNSYGIEPASGSFGNGGNWYRVWLSVSLTGIATQVYPQISLTNTTTPSSLNPTYASGGKTVGAYGFNAVQTNAYLTSYITAGSSSVASRAADTATFSGAPANSSFVYDYVTEAGALAVRASSYQAVPTLTNGWVIQRACVYNSSETSGQLATQVSNGPGANCT